MLVRHVLQGAGQPMGGAHSLKGAFTLRLEFRVFLVGPWEGREGVPPELGMEPEGSEWVGNGIR